MQFIYDIKNKIDETDNCFLLTNGLGGYSSLTVAGGALRGDQALLMSASKAPNVRFNLIANVFEKLIIDEEEYVITSQLMGDGADYKGEEYLDRFIYDDFCEDGRTAPATWYYEVGGVRLTKSLVMVNDENTVALEYKVEYGNGAFNGKNVRLEVTPLLRFCSKKESFDDRQDLNAYKLNNEGGAEYSITKAREVLLYGATNGKVTETYPKLFGKMYFPQDERDGRETYGNAFVNHVISYDFDVDNRLTVVFSTKMYEYLDDLYIKMAESEKARKLELVKCSGLKSKLAKQLAVSADAYVVKRDSTQGKSIIAGYPFFEDWGRDTMISLAGATLVTGRFEECKSILRTFAKYVRNGLLPNLFPEGGIEPMYNSVDAPLLFINAVYEYMLSSKDYDFKYEVLPVLEQIVNAYINGTDFHIKMDEDGLIMAGAGLEQLTWMDVRVGDFLPTPRHGKPVEINAYWYSALMIMEKLTGKSSYGELAIKVKEAFNEKFWNNTEQCLYDVLSGGEDEGQIRCNQIWALTMPFTMLEPKREELIVSKVRKELYTTIGLRTLSMKDKDFHGIYIGEMEERDRAYHQGTVWAFPLGAYYLACIKLGLKGEVDCGIKKLEYWLHEGCAAQIAEIYDGKEPTISRGCYAQAWSVCELLRAVREYEKI
jgi:predicted glycogen debranching enzyme